MEFETQKMPDGKDPVQEFLLDLEDHKEEEYSTAFKITEKLSSFQQLTFGELIRAEHIKKVAGKIFEVRVRIKTDCYRFLGVIKGEIFYMLHGIKKKTQKLTRKDIEIATTRSKCVKYNENQ